MAKIVHEEEDWYANALLDHVVMRAFIPEGGRFRFLATVFYTDGSAENIEGKVSRYGRLFLQTDILVAADGRRYRLNKYLPENVWQAVRRESARFARLVGGVA